VALSIFLAFTAGEVIIRLLKPQYTFRGLKDIVGRYYAPSEFNSFTLQTNYRGTEPSQEYPDQRVEVTTNSLGLRGKEFLPAELSDSTRILVLGDSYTFGVYVNDNETFCSILEQHLRKEDKRAVVLNAGYASGFETDEQYCWLVNRGIQFQPDIIILAAFHGNDIVGIAPQYWLQVDGQGLPTKIRDPDLFVQDGFLRTLTLDQKAAGGEFVYRLPILRQSHLCIAINRLVNRLVMPPDLYGKTATNRTYRHIFGEDSAEFFEKERIFLKLIQGMKHISEANNAKFLVLMIPFNFEVNPPRFQKAMQRYGVSSVKKDYYSELELILKGMNIPFINLLNEMRSIPQKGFYPRNGEVHLNAAGHRFVAAKLKEFLLNHNWIPN